AAWPPPRPSRLSPRRCRVHHARQPPAGAGRAAVPCRGGGAGSGTGCRPSHGSDGGCVVTASRPPRAPSGDRPLWTVVPAGRGHHPHWWRPAVHRRRVDLSTNGTLPARATRVGRTRRWGPAGGGTPPDHGPFGTYPVPPRGEGTLSTAMNPAARAT